MLVADIYLGDVWAISLGVIGFLLSLQGLWLVCRALWPRLVERLAVRCQLRPVACFFLGLLVSGVILLIGIAAGKRLGGGRWRGLSFYLSTSLVQALGCRDSSRTSEGVSNRRAILA